MLLRDFPTMTVIRLLFVEKVAMSLLFRANVPQWHLNLRHGINGGWSLLR